jgi:four helix bundle protein
MKKIKSHKDLEVYQMAYDAANRIFKLSKTFPKEELYSLTDQIRKSSRSVATNIAEAFRKRKYERAFVSKLSDAEAEAAETQVWLDFSLDCGYISIKEHEELYTTYDRILGMLVNMAMHPEHWSFGRNN